MSATLKWKPVRPDGKGLSDATKFFFQDAYSLHEGTATLTESDTKYLAGAIAATKDKDMKSDLKVLLEAIEKFGTIQVWLEY